ncbi:MAG: sugar phosphate nucleotidyltransferase [Candidatus Berkelbacteria bacterium]|nr:sugar phosphate nucleotidyltransferase [Candidatus Berkelbacteria bacterium]
MYAVIMASGQGTRLWPMSRQNKPKQFHSLVGKNTMIQDTYLRLRPKFSDKNILVTVTKDYYEEAKIQLPELPIENFIIEPRATGTLGTCAMAIAKINRINPKAKAIFLPSDHIINEPEKFLEIVDFADELINKYPDYMTLIGINPTRADTGMGYIRMNSQIETRGDLKVFSVKGFEEKPNAKTAEKYLASWEYLWNGGMFVWTVAHAISLFHKHCPETLKAAQKIMEETDPEEYLEIATLEYKNIERTSVDYAIAEKEKNILVIPSDIGWSDVGSWGTLSEVLRENKGVSVIAAGNHLGVDNSNCLILAGDKLIATVGLNDIVVIDTPDAILICKGSRSQQVKALIEKLREEGKDSYL